jgi:hypothetical protein
MALTRLVVVYLVMMARAPPKLIFCMLPSIGSKGNGTFGHALFKLV